MLYSDILKLSKYQHMSESELQARKSGFSFVELDGNIAIIGNGAGLVMSTLDIVSDQGGKAGCFLDFGGSATAETIYDSLKVISKTKKIKVYIDKPFRRNRENKHGSTGYPKSLS